MKKRIMAALMAFAVVSALPLRVLADEWYLEDGDIHIEATSTDGGATQTQTVTQNSVSTPRCGSCCDPAGQQHGNQQQCDHRKLRGSHRGGDGGECEH